MLRNKLKLRRLNNIIMQNLLPLVDVIELVVVGVGCTTAGGWGIVGWESSTWTTSYV